MVNSEIKTMQKFRDQILYGSRKYDEMYFNLISDGRDKYLRGGDDLGALACSAMLAVMKNREARESGRGLSSEAAEENGQMLRAAFSEKIRLADEQDDESQIRAEMANLVFRLMIREKLMICTYRSDLYSVARFRKWVKSNNVHLGFKLRLMLKLASIGRPAYAIFRLYVKLRAAFF